jgi:aryl-alcohol dehydrogenase-like predicted oxidoreductase
MKSRSNNSDSPTTHLDPATLRATIGGTARYARRFERLFVPGFHRQTTFGLSVSSLGIGTYLGECDDREDGAYTRSVLHAIDSGVNLIDTAINYRCQRSELAVGAAIQEAISRGEVARESLMVCTKGGYVPLDHEAPKNREAYQGYVQREFIDRGIFAADDLVAGGHCLAPRFLLYCIAKSRQNLGLRTIDVYYLHNPEQQLSVIGRKQVQARLRTAFTSLEEAAGRGDIGVYGCATWNGLRVPPEARGHLSLEELVGLARDVAGDRHHFRAVQLPINLAMPEAVRAETQTLRDHLVTPLEAARELGLTVIGSASLMQAKLASGLPEPMRELFPHCETDAQRAIEFTRTMAGVTTALVGTREPRHFDENLGCARA